MRGVRPFLELVVFPVASALFLCYVIWRSIPGLGGWTGRNMEYLYALLALGIALMVYAKVRGESDYFDQPLEAYEPASGSRVAASMSAQPVGHNAELERPTAGRSARGCTRCGGRAG